MNPFMKTRIPLLIFFITLFHFSCKKDNTTDPGTSPVSSEKILSDFSYKVALATYADLSSKGAALDQSVSDFIAAPSQQGLETCRAGWKNMRAAWEQSEGFLFGPVSFLDIDPSIDTWPVSFTSLDSLLSSPVTFDQTTMNQLEFSLKGFHPLEYLLFGQNGNRLYTDFTQRDFEYARALSIYLKDLSAQVYASWDPNQPGNYLVQVTEAGTGSGVYSSRKAAVMEIVNAMISICDEVANGKIEEPFINQDPSLEESPYAKNSLTDFIDNMKSVENIYLCRYSEDGTGLNDFVRSFNISLDNSIRQKITAAITALQNISLPFGEAIIQQPIQVQQAQAAINDLRSALENDLMPFIQAKVTD